MATFQDKVNRIVQSLTQRTGLINIVPGSIAHQISEAVAYEQMQIESIVENDAVANSILSATGNALDAIGAKFLGIERRRETKTFVTSDMKLLKFYVKQGTFGDINSGLNILIPIGTTIEGSIDGIFIRMRVTEQYTLLASDYEKFISVEQIQGPVESIPSGVLNKHYFTDYSQSQVGSLLVINPNIIATGSPKESDENYRYRISNGLRAFAKTNTFGIFDSVTSVPGVSYAIVDPFHNGGGTFAVYVQATSPITPDSLLDTVKEVCSQNIGPWVTYEIIKPSYIGLELDITLTMRNPLTYLGNTGFLFTVQDRISSYINNFIGDTFYLLDITKIVEDSHEDILEAKFNIVNRYVGLLDKFRVFESVNLIDNYNPTIGISNTEKLVVEPIVNPITLRIE